MTRFGIYKRVRWLGPRQPGDDQCMKQHALSLCEPLATKPPKRKPA